MAAPRARSLTKTAKAAKRPVPIPTKVRWLDAVLGGGIVPGGVYMVVGGPGVGKTTMLMQAMSGFVSKKRPGLYVSGDQTEDGIAVVFARANGQVVPPRSRTPAGALWSALGTRAKQKAAAIEAIHTRRSGEAAGAIREHKPALVVIDSVQAFRDAKVSKAQRGHSVQVDILMNTCIDEAKKVGAAIVFVFHTTKEGLPAGPKNATSRVDCRLDLDVIDEYEFSGCRQLCSHKNRFARSNVARVLELTKEGLLVEARDNHRGERG